MSYMTLSSQEKHLFLLCSYFRVHPTKLLLKILGGTDACAVPPTSNFGGAVPPVLPRSPPLGFSDVFDCFVPWIVTRWIILRHFGLFHRNLRGFVGSSRHGCSDA